MTDCTRGAGTRSERARIAIAGAGAVVERFHLPAARKCPELRIVALADTNVERATALARRFGVPRAVADYRDLGDDTDGVLIALPNFLHAPATIHFLRAGVAALVEKPVALGVTELQAMVDAARAGNTVLAAAMVTRHAVGARWIKRAIDDGLLGTLKSFALEFGSDFSWPVASSFLFDRARAGGGVLIDVGTHMLDLAVWWLGAPVLVEYRDDSMGGVEAECVVTLSFGPPPNAVHGTITVSRLRPLANIARIVGERRAVEWDITAGTVRVESFAQAKHDEVPMPPRPRPMLELLAEQLRLFAGAAVGMGAPAVTGDEAMTVVDLIERCYRERRFLEQPWARPVLSVVPSTKPALSVRR